MRFGQAGIGGDAQPVDGLLIVARDTFTAVVKVRQVDLSHRITVLRGSQIPFEGFTRVFGNALPMLIEGSQIVFGGSVMHVRGGFIVSECQSVVLGDEFAVFVEVPQIKFGIGITLGGGGVEPLDRCLYILLGGIVREQESGEAILRARVASFGQ